MTLVTFVAILCPSYSLLWAPQWLHWKGRGAFPGPAGADGVSGQWREWHGCVVHRPMLPTALETWSPHRDAGAATPREKLWLCSPGLMGGWGELSSLSAREQKPAGCPCPTAEHIAPVAPRQRDIPPLAAHPWAGGDSTQVQSSCQALGCGHSSDLTSAPSSPDL